MGEGRLEESIDPPRSARRSAPGLALAFAACLPALLDPGAIARAAALDELARSPNPWFLPAHSGLLYLWAPCVALSASFLFLLPGLLLARALGAARELGRWILCGLALSIAAVSLAAMLAQAALGAPLTGAAFAGVALVCAALAALAPVLARRRGADVSTCLETPRARRLAALSVAACWGLLAALAPKFHWEAFNGDGVHAYEATRLLLSRALPFWDAEAGPIAFYPGVTSALFAFPGSWFLRLFGPCEAAVRLPVLLYLAAMFAGVLALAEPRRALGLAEGALVWLALAVYFVVLAFSASYDPYSADVALPATQDTLLVACFLGFALAWDRGERGWMLAFLALTYLSLPSGLVLVLLFAAAAWLVERPRPWKRAAWTAAGLAGCMVFAALLPRALAALDLPLPGEEYAKESMLQRFMFLQFTDARRLLYVVLPCGIVPALALFAWRALDPLARALALVALGYFALFFVQAYVSLHHFVPAMLLPLAAFWRSDLAHDPRRRPWLLGATAVAGLAALVLSLPADRTVAMAGKDVGRALEMRVPGYERSAPEAFASAAVLEHLFPRGLDPDVPAKKYGGSAFPWNYYARRAEGAARAVNYVVQPASEPPLEGATRVAEQGGYALYVRDLAAWERRKTLVLPSPPGSALLAIDRGLLFGQAPRERKLFILNVRSFLRKLGAG